MMNIQKPMISSTGRKFIRIEPSEMPLAGLSRVMVTPLLTSWLTKNWSCGPLTVPPVPSARLKLITLVTRVPSLVNCTEEMRPLSTSRRNSV